MEQKMTPEDEEKFGKYFKRIKEEVMRALSKEQQPAKFAGNAGWLLARFAKNRDAEYAEEAAVNILAGTFLTRGKKEGENR